MQISRRSFLATALASAVRAEQSPTVAITMDDVNWAAIPEAYSRDANARLLRALESQGRLRAALFVIGRNADSPNGSAIVRAWSDAGHLIGNHTYSHQNYENADPAAFEQDVLRCEATLRDIPGYRKFFRFPMLREGRTAETRDRMRGFLGRHGYRNGHVTIDASDWYYDQRLRARLKEEPSFEVQRYRQPYLDHIWDRATHYDALSRRVLGRSVPHTLLIHYNLLNALFLGDLAAMFVAKGWRLVHAEDAYADAIFTSQPKTVPAGESLIWALAKQTGRFDKELRYPGEDDVYEKPKLEKLGL